MLEKLLQKRGLLMGVGSVLLLFICYWFAFSKTIEAWQLNKQLTVQSMHPAEIVNQPSYIIRKGKNIKQTLNLYKIDTIEVRNNILSRIAVIAEGENIQLSEVPVQDVPDSSSFIMVQKLNFQGNYVSLLKFLDKVNQTAGVGIIRSMSIKSSKKNGEQKNGPLICEAYFEMLKATQ